MKKNIIFFGGAGFLGNYFCQKLVSLGNKVTVIDLKFPKIRIKKVKYVKGDMCNQKFISKFIKKGSYIFNFAGNASIEGSNEFPLNAQKLNIMGNSTILEVCKKKNIARYIYASSLYVFSKYGGFYKATKQSCELLIQEYNKNYKIPFTIIRFGSLYGPGAGSGNAIYDLISMAYKNRSINYWGQGNEIRQYIHARDAAKVCDQIFFEKFKNKSLLITGLEDIRMRDLLNTVKEMFDNKIEIEFDYNKRTDAHYKNTPFTIDGKDKEKPIIGEKLLFESYTDIGQGIYELANYLIKIRE